MLETTQPTGDAANDEFWRLFVAVELPRPVRERLAAVIRRLSAAGWRARWVKPEASHLTLKFYGNVPTAGIAALEAALCPAVAGVAPCRVEAAGAGAFPNARRPRVLWLGVGGDVAALLRLQQAVERASAALGFPPEERAFRPHLTLGRVAPEDLGSLTRIPERLAEVAAQPALPMPVDRVTLFRSLLSRAGTVYSLVETFPLGGDLS